MKILVDINHPAHVHFFRNPIKLLLNSKHNVIVTSREKDVTITLLNELGIKNIKLSSTNKGGLIGLAYELIHRDLKLYRVVKKEKPDIMLAVGGTFIAHVGRVTRTPSVVFYDTENATIQNLITYPLATLVVVPNCYEAWTPRPTKRYAGYHELSYLHPNYFKPCYATAKANGLAEGKKNLFIRLVSWNANHDVGEKGWSLSTLKNFTDKFSGTCNILISSESVLPKAFKKYAYSGHIKDVHHVLAFCNAFIGESATMASEAAVLGTPAIYAAKTGRGYTNELEKKYRLVKNIPGNDWPIIEQATKDALNIPKDSIKKNWELMINESIDVAKLVSDLAVAVPRNSNF